MTDSLSDAIVWGAGELGVDPVDVATAMSYETGGTFDPWKIGPVTKKYGQHIGLIQWGTPQREQYGVYKGMSNHDQVASVVKYMKDAGVKPGMKLLDIYSAINAGSVGHYNAVDSGSTVAQKVATMASHRRNALRLLEGKVTPQSSAGDGVVAPDYTLSKPDTQTGTEAPLGLSFAQPDQSFAVAPDKNLPADPGFLQLSLDALRTKNSIGAAFEGAPAGKYDPNYQLTEDKLKGYLQGLDAERYSSWFNGASSEENAQAIRQAALANNQRYERLSQGGITGAALELGAALLDPVAIGAGLVTEGAGTELIAGAKLSKPAWVLSKALLGSTSGAAAVGATAPFVDGVDAHSIIAGAALGGVLGTAIGALSKNPAMLDELVRFRDAVKDHNVSQSSGGLQLPNNSAGAAKATGTVEDFLQNTDLSKIQDHEVPKTFLSSLRGGWGVFDTAGALRSSKNPLTRWLGTNLTKDAADPTVITATEEKAKFQDLWGRAFFQRYNPALKDWLKTRGAGKVGTNEATTRFNEEITAFVRDRGFLAADNYHPAVVKVGQRIRELQNEIRKMANNPFIAEGLQGRSVAGFEDLAENPFYMLRAYDAKKIQAAREAHGDDGVASAFEQAMQKADPKIPSDLRARAAKGFAKAVINRAHDVDSNVARVLGTENLQEVADILVHEGGLSKADAEDLLRKYRAGGDAKRPNAKGTNKKLPSDTEAINRGKHRLFMDETAKVTVKNRFTGEDVQTSIADLFLHNDAQHLFGKYAHQMAGRVAMARLQLKDPKTGEVLVDGITSDREAAKLINEIDKRGADLGLSEKQRTFDKNRFEYLFNYLSGRATRAVHNQHVDDWVRAFEKFNYVRVMNQAGFAQMPEIAGVISTAGLKAFATHMPAFRRLVDGAGDSRLINEAANDMETFIAYGVERLTHNDFARLDDMAGHIGSMDRGRVVDKVSGGLTKLSRWTSDVSGMNIVNMAIQRSAAMSMVQKFVDMAHGGKFALGKARLRTMGLDEAMTERIYQELRNPNNVETVRGALTGRKIKRLHFDKWTDLQAKEAFRNALFRTTRQIIQTNDIGMMSQWMSHPVGRVLVQFRRFVFGSFTNHLLYNSNLLLRHGDMRALSFFLTSTLFSGLSYALWQQIKTIGREDRQDYLAKRLSWGEIAKASFARSGYSSILPMLMDSGPSQALTGKEQFDFRTTGQPADILFGNPTTGFVNDFQNALNGITHPLLNQRGITKKEVNDIARVFPFANSIPAVITLNSMNHGLEDRPPRNDFQSFNTRH